MKLNYKHVINVLGKKRAHRT